MLTFLEECTASIFGAEVRGVRKWMKMAVFWVVVPRNLVEVYSRFRSTCCLHHQGTDGGSKYL
jgi:hypothetical protein